MPTEAPALALWLDLDADIREAATELAEDLFDLLTDEQRERRTLSWTAFRIALTATEVRRGVGFDKRAQATRVLDELAARLGADDPHVTELRAVVADWPNPRRSATKEAATGLMDALVGAFGIERGLAARTAARAIHVVGGSLSYRPRPTVDDSVESIMSQSKRSRRR